MENHEGKVRKMMPRYLPGNSKAFRRAKNMPKKGNLAQMLSSLVEQCQDFLNALGPKIHEFCRHIFFQGIELFFYKISLRGPEVWSVGVCQLGVRWDRLVYSPVQ